MKQLTSNDNRDIYIARSSTEGKVAVKLVAKFLVRILLLAIKNVSATMKTTNLRISSLLFGDSRNK